MDKSKFVLNPKTNRWIMKGGPLHRKLMSSGEMPVVELEGKRRKKEKKVSIEPVYKELNVEEDILKAKEEVKERAKQMAALRKSRKPSKDKIVRKPREHKVDIDKVDIDKVDSEFTDV